MVETLPIRVARRTEVRDLGFETPCWVCDLSVNQWGYARVRWPTGSSPKMVAHKAIYELLGGEVPQGLELDHLCRVPNCVRPDHLEPVTKSVNFKRSRGPAISAARQLSKTHCPKDHPYTPENTWVNKAGHRACKRCHANREFARYHMKAARVEVAQTEDANVQDVVNILERDQ